MDISKRIVFTFTAVALIPILFISALSATTIIDVSNANATDAAAALEAEERANLIRLASDTSQFIDERMQNYVDGVYMMEQYAEDLFNGRIGATPQDSYFYDPTLESSNGHPVPGLSTAYYDLYGSYEISFDVSCYYMPRTYYPTPGDPLDLDATTQYFLDVTSNMDNIYRSLHNMSSDYIWLYMQIDESLCSSHLFRNYPYDNLTYFWEDSAADDYDGQVEDWYTNAEALSIDDDSIAFTSPYGDPSTGLVISMGRPIYFDNGTFIGVVSADVTLDTVLENVLNIEVLETGYAYLLESDGNVLAHPDISDEPQTIFELEFGSSTNQDAQTFSTILATALATENGQANFTKGSEQWYLTYETIPNSGFLLAIVVPSDEVIAPALAILAEVTTQTTFLIFILGGVLALVAVVVTGVSFRRGRAVVEPIKEMTRLVTKMAKQDFTRSITATGSMYEEIGTTVDALLSFQEACRFGNQAFVRGDLRRALANYQNLLEISKKLGIEAGEQTMYLNIGNIFRQRGDTANALEYYQTALDIANKLLEKTKADGSEENDAMARVASVYHNMALVEMDRQKFDKALSLLEDAEAIDRTIGNNRGLAKRFDAMGLVLMRQGRESQALSRFNEAKETAEYENYDRSLAYINYHTGEFHQEQQDWRNAKASFNEAIRLGNLTEEFWLVVYSMQKLADVLDEMDESSHDVRRKAESLRRSILFKKSVIFVIDYSGSMRAQDRIRAAVTGAKEIVDTQVNPQDQVSIIVFNSSYEQLLPLTVKGNYEDESDSPIIQKLNSLRYPNYATAFYDALGKALEDLNLVESSEHRWVIALTDGQDNSSTRYSLDALKGIFTEKDRQKRKRPLTVEGFIRDNHLDVNLLVIGVGDELRSPIEKNVRSKATGQRMTFEELLDSVCGAIPQGQYISVTDSRNVRLDIAKAFEEVGVLMAQLEMGGTTDDY